ncbi:XRE family transcriptional regulator [Acinetobacter guillouiae]|jgi:predicted transcriptional regulator|uniref:XRE family transcriptional regulator n=1 Tax=Acinetobacter guillouiae TaxID=106649 RepID=UPI003AF7F2B0
MAKKFSELRSKMPIDAQQKVHELAQEMTKDMPLQELREARKLSQKVIAELLNVQQPAIAKMEKRTDMYVSTLRSHIEAMGGELEIIAKFPEGAVRITNFTEM